MLRRRVVSSLLGFVALALLAFAPTCLKAEVVVPSLSGPVIDEAHLLSSAEQRSLDVLIRSFMPKVQMQIWTFESLQNEPIESVSIRAVEKWKLGTAKDDNGLLITVAKADRRMRIEVGQGLEGAIPDALAGRVIDQIMKPAFRAGNYSAGLEEAVRFLAAKAGGEAVSLPKNPRRSLNSNVVVLLIFILFFASPLLSVILSVFFGIRPRYRSGGWGGSGGFGGGGGGWSGGGGGFSGGGSSGSW